MLGSTIFKRRETCSELITYNEFRFRTQNAVGPQIKFQADTKAEWSTLIAKLHSNLNQAFSS